MVVGYLICGLFDEDVSSLEYIASNDMINEQLTEKCREGKSSSLI
jgi:hypothetical protein